MKIPYAHTVYDEQEVEAVVRSMRTSMQMGANVAAFENKVALLFDKKYGVMVNSGSSALQLALEILMLPSKAEVITPALTFSTTVSAIVKNGLIPAFIDVKEETYNIDANLIEDLITEKTKVLLIPNLNGNLPDWVKLREIADRHQLILIEDSADTLGAKLNGKKSGYYADMSIASFYGSHLISCAGNGGMICLNNEKWVNKCRLLRSWGRDSSLFDVDGSEEIENRFNHELDGIPYDAKFTFSEIGYNFQPSEMGAAFGLVQLKRLEGFKKSRIENCVTLTHFFEPYEKWFILTEQKPNCEAALLAFALTIRDEAPFQRKELQIYLEKSGIQTRTLFAGNILRQPGFKNIERKEHPNGYPAADKVMRGGLLIGCHQGLTLEMINYIKSMFTTFLNQYSHT